MVDETFELPPDAPYPAGQENTPGLSTFLENLRLRRDLTKVCESPIEIDLGAALMMLAEGRYLIEPQHEAGGYRYDFSVRSLPTKKLLCLVECDGKEFHSTPGQKANDQAKDRLAESFGIRVVRLTGREIYRDPAKAAETVIMWARAAEAKG